MMSFLEEGQCWAPVRVLSSLLARNPKLRLEFLILVVHDEQEETQLSSELISELEHLHFLLVENHSAYFTQTRRALQELNHLMICDLRIHASQNQRGRGLNWDNIHRLASTLCHKVSDSEEKEGILFHLMDDCILPHLGMEKKEVKERFLARLRESGVTQILLQSPNRDYYRSVCDVLNEQKVTDVIQSPPPPTE